jgi:hypothetical protein
MKRAVLALTLFTLPASLFAQGPLAPPGAPAPTMVTLSQIEPRIPISSVPYTITASGSYYLTTNLNVTGGNAITINANGVTLDLKGFTISSTAASANGTGILLGGVNNICILNGNISGSVTWNGSVYTGSGFANGIYISGSPYNIRVTGVSVYGVLDEGINLGNGNATVIESCTANTVGDVGMEADSIANSSAQTCGNYGVLAITANNCSGTSTVGSGLYAYTAVNCYGLTTGTGDGLITQWSALNCYGQAASSSIGLYCGGTAENCSGRNSGNGGGLAAGNAIDCYGFSNGGGEGLYATYTAQNCYGQNNGTGDALSANNAENCQGYNTGNGDALNIGGVALNCYGTSANGLGLSAYTAENCVAIGGLFAYSASNCTGINNNQGFISGGYGLYASYSAVNCYGSATSATGLLAGLYTMNALNCYGSASNAPGVLAVNANFCFGSGTPAVTVTGNKYNMP